MNLLVQPGECLHVAAHAHCGFYSAKHRSAYGTHLLVVVLGLVYHVDKFGSHFHLLGVHAMLCEVLDIDLAIVAKARVHGEESCFDAFYLHALHQFTAEVQSCGRSHHGTLFGCEYALIALGIGGNGFALDIGGQGVCPSLYRASLNSSWLPS